ncbi:hypothetical protein Golob_026096 [Gossypium lobatum]|uniref:Reverse transcriptase zinc-binding domain-containing protein n=1 Tax=Gossypium lobatum TaxID=34289 RepID=A0A7J8LU22_9ROSI|nr:hypothetical protein [Gossypium lobatum]
MLCMKVVESLDNYLGLPLHVGKKKSKAFASIINRFSGRINNWSKRLLIYGGREIFTKSILLSLLTYALSVFLAPRGMIEEMQASMVIGFMITIRLCMRERCMSYGTRRTCTGRVFAWRLEHDLLPTKDRIASMHQHGDRECFRCGDKRETLIHALKDCPNARAVLTMGALMGDLLITNFLDEKPSIDKVKVDFDATIINNKFGFDVLTRDDEGFVVGGTCGFRVENMQAEWVELHAFEESIKVASSMHTANIIFETGCTSLAIRIRNRSGHYYYRAED